MSTLLTLDTATATGWAFGPVDNLSECEYGTITLENTGDDLGSFFAEFEDRLRDLIQSLKPELLVFEAPILYRTNTQKKILRKLYGLTAYAETTGLKAQVRVAEADLTDIRTHFIHRTQAPRSIPKKDRTKWLKGTIMEQCRRMGWNPENDNEGDALALRSFVIWKATGFLHPTLVTDLFQEAG
ncbi:hypothetical protein QMT40_001808 [Parvibaculaceae bacterium PLY_AMNH_Bact1]|nr:hypothetical protein QMT40_001808 [Parvibaculaceae bacterium PLY_AMNH_Bact1]